MNETKPQKMNLEHERRIVALQERVERLEKSLLFGKGSVEPGGSLVFPRHCQEYALQTDGVELAALLQAGGQTDLL